jgi:NUMOD4 motif/HNH endonuclease
MTQEHGAHGPDLGRETVSRPVCPFCGSRATDRETAPERWRSVPSEPGYAVSDHGRVRSLDRALSDGRTAGGVMLTATPDRDGYLRVRLRGRWRRVHHLVLEAFAEQRPDGMEGCHGNDVRDDNHLANLRWDTHGENERDKRRIGK